MTGPYLRTAGGRNIYLHPGRPLENFHIEDAAAQLAKINRFLGATRVPYSVAQHSVWVMQRIREAGHGPIIQMAGIIHDIPEYIFGDMARPVQIHFFGSDPDANQWAAAQWSALSDLQTALGLPNPMPAGTWEIVKHFDDMALRTEWRDLMTGPEPDDFTSLPECHHRTVIPWFAWETAQIMFLQEFEKLQTEIATKALR